MQTPVEPRADGRSGTAEIGLKWDKASGKLGQSTTIHIKGTVHRYHNIHEKASNTRFTLELPFYQLLQEHHGQV